MYKEDRSSEEITSLFVALSRKFVEVSQAYPTLGLGPD